MEEDWQIIDSYPRYLISNLGNVLNRENNRILKSSANTNGYPKVHLARDGNYKSMPVHRLVAFAFLSGYFEGALVNHIDGNRQNSRVDNLEWITHRENTTHAVNIGLTKRTRIVQVLDGKTKRPIKDPRIVARRYT